MNKKCETCPRVDACLLYLLSLPTSEIIIRCKMLRKVCGATSTAIAERTKVPKGTVERIFAKGSEDTDIRVTSLLPVVWYLAEKCGISVCYASENGEDKDVERLTELVTEMREHIADLRTENERLSKIVDTLMPHAILTKN